jgi:hypothetical protein
VNHFVGSAESPKGIRKQIQDVTEHRLCWWDVLPHAQIRRRLQRSSHDAGQDGVRPYNAPAEWGIHLPGGVNRRLEVAGGGRD